MKFSSKTLLPAMNKATLKDLTTITKETLAVSVNNVKSFTAAELWNVQKQRRAFHTRRFI